MGYRVLADAPERSVAEYTVRSVRPSDAEPIRAWRNANLPILRQAEPLSYREQQAYFWDVVRPDLARTEPRQILMVLLEEGSRVAYGGLTYIDWYARRAELSFLADPNRTVTRYAGALKAFLDLVVREVAFKHLDLRRVWHETWGRPASHYVVLEEFGFVEEGRLRQHRRIGDVYHDVVFYGLLSDA